MSSTTAYSFEPSCALFEEPTRYHKLRICTDIKDLCGIFAENHNRIKGEDEMEVSPESQLPGLCSAVDELGGPDRVFNFSSPEGLYQRLIRVASEVRTLFPTRAIPTLARKGGNGSVQLSARQICCILANAVLGNLSRLPLKNTSGSRVPFRTIPHYGSLSWHLVFGSTSSVATARAKGLLLYFQKSLFENNEDSRKITFRRLTLDLNSFSLTRELSSKNTLTPITFFEGGVELCSAADAMVDFANEDLHIGAVWPSATQEEVLFTIHPECFAGILFCETMDENEAIQISGVRSFCKTTGFQGTFQVVTGPSSTSSDNKTKTVLAMDASIADSGKNWISDQCSGPTRDRDIIKAVAAFSSVTGHSVATGHWGCGAFGGDMYCKFLAQWIAASLSDVSLVYCLVGHDSVMVKRDLEAIYNCLYKNQWTPEQVVKAMSGYCGPESPESMRSFLLKTLT